MPAAVAKPALLSAAAFAELLRSGNLDQLDRACQQSIEADRLDRLRQLQARMLALHPAPQPLDLLLANAEALIGCRAPQAALTVLDRIGPAPGPEQVRWLVMQWRAATAAFDHRRAALALERLALASPGGNLGSIGLPVLRRPDGSVVLRPALDLLVDHLEALGRNRQAAELLLASPGTGPQGAERLQQAVRLWQTLPAAEKEQLLDRALDQAAAAGAWGLVASLLDDEVALPSARARERRLRLSPRIDDAYGEWLLRRDDPASASRSRQLERQLRSPVAPGGHAPAPLPAPLPAPAPASLPPSRPPSAPSQP